MSVFTGYEVKVHYDSDKIELLVQSHDGHGRTETIAWEIVKLREKAVREALIALGWTPPAEPNPSNNTA